jgi:hypothetical protein
MVQEEIHDHVGQLQNMTQHLFGYSLVWFMRKSTTTWANCGNENQPTNLSNLWMMHISNIMGISKLCHYQSQCVLKI